jgi:hypothetical protein
VVAEVIADDDAVRIGESVTAGWRCLVFLWRGLNKLFLIVSQSRSKMFTHLNIFLRDGLVVVQRSKNVY